MIGTLHILMIILIIFFDRLEYLGDAVLDFLVIRCIFVEHYKEVTPSKRYHLSYQSNQSIS